MTAITRRGAMLGASAAVAVVAVPTAVEAKPADSEVEFLHTKMKEALKALKCADEAHLDALRAFRKLHPTPLVLVEQLRPRARLWCEHEDNIERVFGYNRRTMSCDPEYWPEEYRQLYWAADNDPENRELYGRYRKATRQHDRRVRDDVSRRMAAVPRQNLVRPNACPLESR